MRAFAEIATAEPAAMSLVLLGAFGAGPKMLERRGAMLGSLEQRIQQSLDGAPAGRASELTVRFIIGGIREVAAGRLIGDHADQLPGLAEELSAWASSYPPRLPAGLSGSARPNRTAPNAIGACPQASTGWRARRWNATSANGCGER